VLIEEPGPDDGFAGQILIFLKLPKASIEELATLSAVSRTIANPVPLNCLLLDPILLHEEV